MRGFGGSACAPLRNVEAFAHVTPVVRLDEVRFNRSARTEARMIALRNSNNAYTPSDTLVSPPICALVIGREDLIHAKSTITPMGNEYY